MKIVEPAFPIQFHDVMVLIRWVRLTDTNYSATIGDGSGAQGSASLTYIIPQYFIRTTGITASFLIKSDGALTVSRGGSAITWGYSTTSIVRMTLAGGSVNVNGTVDLAGGTTSAGSSWFDFTAAGASFTAKFGGDFTDLATVNTYIGSGLTFRSSTPLTLAAQDNLDGSFTVAVVPEPRAALLGALGLLALLRRRR